MPTNKRFNLKRATTPDGDVRLIMDDSDDLMLSELREQMPAMPKHSWEAVVSQLKARGIVVWRGDDGRHEVRVPADFELDYMGITDAGIEHGLASEDPEPREKARKVEAVLYGGPKTRRPS